MNSAIERLLGLRISDIMTSPVTTIQENASMSEAAQVMIAQEITGLPVIDVTGRCVGILSNSDFAAREYRATHGEAGATFGPEHALVQSTHDGPWHVEAIAENRVGEHMSPLVQTVNPTATLLAAGRILCREHIHRLVIVDDDQRPIGMVTSLDLVAAVIAAVEE